jgi:hypothetical protein
MPIVKYRLHREGTAPRMTEVPVPGWGGDAQPRADGNHEQVWHCTPFSEGARYGMELTYPFEQELRVSTFRGKVRLEADWGPAPLGGLMWPPFRSFGEGFYSHQQVLDLKVPPGFAVRFETHPRFYAAGVDDVPLAVPALIRTSWWPMVFFLIFKAPPKGVTHVFRKGEPYAHMIVIPEEPDLVLEEMGEEEAAERELQARRIHASRDALSEGTRWVSSTKTVFDGTYRHMLRAAKARDRGKA